MNTVQLAASDIQAFRRDGAVCLRGMFDAEWVALVARGIEINLTHPGPYSNYADGESRRFFQDANSWRRISAFEHFARVSPARLIAAQLLGATRLNFLHDHVLVKEAQADRQTPWHQDQPYSPVDGSQFCTMWMPVDPVPRDTVLEFVAGSHRDGIWYRPQRFIDGALRDGDDERWQLLPDIDARRDAYEILGWGVEPGDVLVFHGLTLHGAPANQRPTRRRVLSTRWTGDDARFQRRAGKMSPPAPLRDCPPDGGVLDCADFPVVWRAGDA
ncbi:MAG: phytanoyl-CoA dioxygenase family protein [Janthinobacterium lividum]